MPCARGQVHTYNISGKARVPVLYITTLSALYYNDSHLFLLPLNRTTNISKLHGYLLEFPVQNDNYYKHMKLHVRTYAHVIMHINNILTDIRNYVCTHTYFLPIAFNRL